MRRREVIALVSATAAWPLVALAQPAEPMRRVGVLMARNRDDPEGQKQFFALREALAELGWTSGRTLQLDERWTVGNPDEAVKFANELLASKPDMVVANATPSLIALRQATTTTPIVFVSVADPVGQGFVPSLSRPGGNITGFSVEEASMGGKWLEVLKEAAPNVARIAVIYNPNTAPYAPMFFPAMQAAAPRMAAALAISPIHSPEDIDRVIAEIGSSPNGGLIVLPDSFMFGLRHRIVSRAAEQLLPAVYPIRFFVSDGGLIAYGIDRVDPSAGLRSMSTVSCAEARRPSFLSSSQQSSSLRSI